MRIAKPLLLAMTLLAGLSGPPARADEADHVRHAMLAMFDKPEARLLVEPVVVRGEHAIAGWTQAEMGGRALLRRHHGSWRVTLCAGDTLREASTLIEAGIGLEEAKALAAGLEEAERRIDPARLLQLARFEGILTIDPAAGHPATGHHPAAGHHPAPR